MCILADGDLEAKAHRFSVRSVAWTATSTGSHTGPGSCPGGHTMPVVLPLELGHQALLALQLLQLKPKNELRFVGQSQWKLLWDERSDLKYPMNFGPRHLSDWVLHISDQRLMRTFQVLSKKNFRPD